MSRLDSLDPFRLMTDRLALTPLRLNQIVRLPTAPSEVAEESCLAWDADAFSDDAWRAVRIKRIKMTIAPPSEYRWFTTWLIGSRAERRVVGCIGFKGVPDEAGDVEIGYGVAASARGQGIGTEAAQRLINWAFEDPRCRGVWGNPLKTNEASIRLLLSCGAEPIGETEHSWLLRVPRPAGHPE